MQRQRRRHSNPSVASARNPFDGRCAISSSPKAAAFIVALTSNKAKRVQSWLAGLNARYMHCMTIHDSAAASRKVPLCLLGPPILWHEPFMEDHIFFLQVLATPVRRAHLHTCTLVLCFFLARVSSSKSFFLFFSLYLCTSSKTRSSLELISPTYQL